ncbi:MAG: non-hydrolyzing UDP-N-acetylglucosamine 2-epimerase [Candidatus Acidiferrales bacterium]
MSVVGARPNFMKTAPIIAAIREFNERAAKTSRPGNESRNGRPLQHILVHTGQHYDESMSDQFFIDLNMPKPDIHLGVGGGSHASQTAEILRKFEEVLVRERPDVLVVVGDVNSTVACALAAAKLPSDGCGRSRPLVVHVESGLRSFDRAMPEEHNRVMTDHLADILFVTEPSGIRNLKREGIPASRVHFVGNTMIDTLVAFQEKAESSSVLRELGLRAGASSNGAKPITSPYALLTLHRPANVDDRDAFAQILEGLSELSSRMPVIFPAHPRTAKRVEEFGLAHLFTGGKSGAPDRAENQNPGCGIRMVPPRGYLDFVCLMKNARVVVTDSGGIQEETTCLRVPCVTIRENTERPVTITSGTNVLAGVTAAGIRKAIRKQLSRRRHGAMPKKWDGKSAHRIVKILATAPGRAS